MLATYALLTEGDISLLLSFLLIFVCYLAIGLYLLPHTIRFMWQHHIVTLNYESKTIPTAMGLFIWLMLIVYDLLFRILGFIPMITSLQEVLLFPDFNTYVIALSVITFIGWLDDTVGHRGIKGLRGHLTAWRDENIVTTGLIKLAGTALMAVWMATVISHHVLFGLLHVVLIMLMTNTMNLLDLRPGRAMKVMFVMFIAVLLCGSLIACLRWLLPILTAAMLLFRKEMMATFMLGDTGSNLLGFALGVTICTATPPWYQLLVVILTAALHWLAERRSLTELIVKHKWLHWLDELGRA